MIVTEMKPFEVIKKELGAGDKISLISCNTCARKCETGGKLAMNNLAEKLKEEGFSVVGQTLVGMPCGLSQLDEMMLSGNVALVLGCDASIHALKTLFPGVKVVPALNTIGLGSWGEDGKVKVIRKFEQPPAKLVV